jgi:hypothetical protein
MSINLCHNTQQSILNGKLDAFIRQYNSCGYLAPNFTRYLEIDKRYPKDSDGTVFGLGYNQRRAKDLLDILYEFKLKGVQ